MGEHSQIIKLDATDSTNLYLKSLVQSRNVIDFTCVLAEKQLKGRGQMGTSWQSESGKNLTFSVLKRYKGMGVEHQFNINVCVSLALYDVLHQLDIPNVKVKWPNDIMSGSDKICGILIENVIKGQSVQYSIIGIGLNVNQTVFQGLDKVASLKAILGKSIDLVELLEMILSRLKHHLDGIETKTADTLFPIYESKLFRKDKPSTFTDGNGHMFMGFVRGVSRQGQLILELEDQQFREFGLKEVRLLY
ncbi:biotin--[acetyl-CoA-carboxylase] ligase [Flagellimonas myxillae]|uniref:biotin--[acetyl-CoA-carboxylase] ligase n=1 Tax=Flagellimonas myxillae TaxID=2942214 RepID=UPI00201F7015|nr:biotin--[acetyl-CoA-carboxylase] ligase [Muricauda myxillae]MCL6268018.1 biotin--[acetyl-CoA-carboxylase] ligase [Muricauda myxillae]